LVVPGGDRGAPFAQAARGREPGLAESHHRDPLLREGLHRIFNVESPTSASTIAMIQKRITMVGSAQPFFSKWWCSGAIRKTRRPVRLYQKTWMMTLTVSTTNNPPTIASTISCLVATATPPSAPPSASEPVSPMKTAAGGALNHRNPSPAPI